MRLLKWLDHNFEEKIMMVLLMILTLIMGLQVVCRYVFNNSLSWTEEISRFLFIWITFLSIAYCIEKQISLRVDQLLLCFPIWVQGVVKIVVLFLSAAFFFYMIGESWKYVMASVASGQRSSATNISIAWVQSSTIVGFFLAFVRSVEEIIKTFISSQSKKKEG